MSSDEVDPNLQKTADVTYMPADLALVNGKVLTMNPSQPVAEAVAITSGKIVKVGTTAEINQLIGKSTRVIDLKGKTVVPGFIDTHIHVGDFGRFLLWVNLSDVTSIEELQSHIRKRAKKVPKGKWIIGHGLDQTQLKEKRFPNLSDLDEASADNPAILYSQTGRICVVNSEALKLAGVTEKTKPPPGGIIATDAETGKLTGILQENATDLVWKIIPEPDEEEIMEAVGSACEKIVATGITSVHWILSSATELPVIQKLLAKRKLPLRIYVIIPANFLKKGLISVLSKNTRSGSVKVGGIEISADGYLSSKTAALFQPYSDDTLTNGKLLCTQEEMNALAARVLKAGLQVVIHAAGDKAVDAALATIEHVSNGSLEKHSWRIDQAALLNEGLLQRIKTHSVIVSVQPRVIATEFSGWSATNRLGPKRARWLYPLRKLLKEGIRIAGGSDCPMEPLSPLSGIQAAVTRESFPEERITVDEALRIYTVDAAYSSNEGGVKGSIEEGKLADLTVLSDDPRTVPPSKIEAVKVKMTIADGEVVYPKTLS